MTSNGPNHYHDDDGIVYACPDCDRAGQLRHREDGVVKCYECGGESDPGDIVERADERGSNLTPELREKGGNNTPVDVEHMREIASLPKGPRGGIPTEVD